MVLVGRDLAKNVMALHGVDDAGKSVLSGIMKQEQSDVRMLSIQGANSAVMNDVR